MYMYICSCTILTELVLTSRFQVPSIVVSGACPRPLNDCRSYRQGSEQISYSTAVGFTMHEAGQISI